jgi:hypothetical protein
MGQMGQNLIHNAKVDTGLFFIEFNS